MEGLDAKQIERANRIIEVAVELGIKVQGTMGKCFRCVRDGEDKPMTLFFNPAKNTFLCKTCDDVGGSVIDLVCQHRDWDKQQALEWLAHRVEFDLMTQKMYHGRGRKK
jgi:hypothetical protein